MNSGPPDPNPAPTGRERRRRLDVLLTERDLAASRTEARGLIMAGRVRVDGTVVDKPGRRVPAEARVEIGYPSHRYVSRGGLKLEKALDFFGLDVSGLVCLDVGASTGGFTDCLLQRGAKRVYAVDVGYGLLAWSLRADPRVVALDRTNARYLDRESFRRAVEAATGQGLGAPQDPDPTHTGTGPAFEWPTFATCDVSFISLLKVVPAILRLLESPWQMVLLVKPQFEAGRGKVGSKGVVRDPQVHLEVLDWVIQGLAKLQARVKGLTYSPIRGPEGNVEYLLWLQSPGAATQISSLERGREDLRGVILEGFASVRDG